MNSALQQLNSKVTMYKNFRITENEYGSFNVTAINCFSARSAEDARQAIDAYIARNEHRTMVNFKARDFREVHQSASEIVVDTTTGLPYTAVYSGPTCTGHIRQTPAVYYFADHWGGAYND